MLLPFFFLSLFFCAKMLIIPSWYSEAISYDHTHNIPKFGYSTQTAALIRTGQNAQNTVVWNPCTPQGIHAPTYTSLKCMVMSKSWVRLLGCRYGGERITNCTEPAWKCPTACAEHSSQKLFPDCFYKRVDCEIRQDRAGVANESEKTTEFMCHRFY